jgi:hypothetical protein
VGEAVESPARLDFFPDVPHWSWHEYVMQVGTWRFFVMEHEFDDRLVRLLHIHNRTPSGIRNRLQRFHLHWPAINFWTDHFFVSDERGWLYCRIWDAGGKRRHHQSELGIVSERHFMVMGLPWPAAHSASMIFRSMAQ